MSATVPKIEVVGVVLAVDRNEADMARVDADVRFSEYEAVFERFERLGFDVQAASLHIDGKWRIEVLS